MKNLLTILCALFFALIAKGQNHVPNGDFELYTQCPGNFSEMLRCTGWRQYTHGTSDFFNTCSNGNVDIPSNWFGYQAAASGKGYAGVYLYNESSTGYKEYIVRDITPLTPGVRYEVAMYIALANNSRFATNDLGVFFYKDGPSSIFTITTLNVKPQVAYTNYAPITDTQNWVRVVDTFIADSAYENMVIGGFIPPANQTKLKLPSGTTPFSYYYIDSVTITTVDTVSPPPVDTSSKDTFSITYSDTWCAGKAITVNLFFRTDTAFDGSNVFSVQLSDKVGNFDDPATIGRIISAKSCKITCLIPAGISGGTYKIRVASTSPVRTWYADKEINILSPPTVITNKRLSVCPGATIRLFANADVPADYIWQGPASFMSTYKLPEINNAGAEHEGIYTVTASYNGCQQSDTVNVTIGCGIVELPKAFTPNGDGNNDVLYIRTNSVFKELDFRIYNRWGQLIFHTSDISTGWDGTFNGQKLNPEVFGYTITGRFSDDSPVKKMGNVTIVK